VSNAIAAGAHHIQVSAFTSGDRCSLVIDDDGIGVGTADGYAAGSGLGLMLSRRVASRFGGALELKPGALGGTRATLEVGEA
jgi:signal transduction histidine kinase